LVFLGPGGKQLLVSDISNVNHGKIASSCCLSDVLEMQTTVLESRSFTFAARGQPLHPRM
jgi:hypothetical protein